MAKYSRTTGATNPANSCELRKASIAAGRVQVPVNTALDQNESPNGSASRLRKSRYCCIAKRREASSVEENWSLSLANGLVPSVFSTPLGMPSPSSSSSGSSTTSTARKYAAELTVVLPPEIAVASGA